MCSFCEKLTSLEDSPEKIGGSFDCAHCKSLTSLNGAPKEVGRNFQCYNCGKKFTKEDVEKVCDVKNIITV